LRFGFHISIAGGLSRVPERAEAKKCQTIQLFSRNPRGWKYRDLDPDQAALMRRGLTARKIRPVFLHMPYLANLASPDPVLRRLSVASLAEELRRAPLVGARYVVCHIGRGLGSPEKKSIDRITKGIDRAFLRVGNGAGLLLETTAGMGSEIGCTFGQLGKIIRGVAQEKRVGVCLDTAHVFQAGYDISTEHGLDSTLAEFRQEIGLSRLKLLHLNDSRTPLGSHVDRHWHVGKGQIGMEGFRRLLKHPAFKRLPAIMETPRTDDREDLANMRMVERLSR
jgi:deoxyribonuclease-4